MTVNSEGNKSWIFIGRTDAEAEASKLWPPNVNSWLIGKDPDVGRDWGQEEKGATEDEKAGWHHWLNGHEFQQIMRDSEGQGRWCAVVHGVAKNQTWLSDWTTTMKLYIENPKDATENKNIKTKNLLGLINKFSKVAGFIQESVAFLYTNNEITEKVKNLKKKPKLGINLTKELTFYKLKTIKHWQREMKMTQRNGNIFHALELEELYC